MLKIIKNQELENIYVKCVYDRILNKKIITGLSKEKKLEKIVNRLKILFGGNLIHTKHLSNPSLTNEEFLKSFILLPYEDLLALQRATDMFWKKNGLTIRNSCKVMNTIYDCYDNIRDGIKCSDSIRNTYKIPTEVFNKEGKIKLNHFIVKKLGISQCPYCNAEEVDIVQNKAIFELDHFFPRSIYPVFAICLYNLVPAGHNCNSLKNNLRTNYQSPYDEHYIIEDLKFTAIFDTCLLNRKSHSKKEIISKKDNLKLGYRIDNELYSLEEMRHLVGTAITTTTKPIIENLIHMGIAARYCNDTDIYNEILKLFTCSIMMPNIWFKFNEKFAGIEYADILRQGAYGAIHQDEDLINNRHAKCRRDLMEQAGIIKKSGNKYLYI